MNDFINFLFSQHKEILSLLMQHIVLTSISIIICILIGVPLGVLISLIKPLKKPVVLFTNVIQAVPTMATLGLLIPMLGIGRGTSILMVVIYCVLPIIKNTYTGLNIVDIGLIEVADSLGLTNMQKLRLVQIPLAIPFIMSGIRISAVLSVGLMTLATLVGAGGVGYLIFTGIQTFNNNMILVGSIIIVILALIIDYIFEKIEQYAYSKSMCKNKKRKRSITFKLNLIILSIIILMSSIFTYSKSKGETISIGTLNFSEQLILGNMLADLVESHTNLNVERKFNLGSTSIAMAAIENKEIDTYIDYTGTLLLNVLKAPMIEDSTKAYDYINTSMENRYKVTLLKPLGFNNTYTIATRKDIAEKNNLNTISDLAKISDKFIFSPTFAFANREDCFSSLSKAYNLKFSSVKAMDGALRYSALNNNQCEFIDAFSTEGLLKVFNLKILKDDKNFFPKYEAVPLVRMEVLNKHPELKKVMNMIAGKLDNNTMIELNYKVDELGESPEEVAKNFLLDKGLI